VGAGDHDRVLEIQPGAGELRARLRDLRGAGAREPRGLPEGRLARVQVGVGHQGLPLEAQGAVPHAPGAERRRLRARQVRQRRRELRGRQRHRVPEERRIQLDEKLSRLHRRVVVDVKLRHDAGHLRADRRGDDRLQGAGRRDALGDVGAHDAHCAKCRPRRVAPLVPEDARESDDRHQKRQQGEGPLSAPAPRRLLRSSVD
jgi:hypothetical protein